MRVSGAVSFPSIETMIGDVELVTASDQSNEAEARRCFQTYLVEVNRRGPAPDSEEQMKGIFAEHEAECDRLVRQEREAEPQMPQG